MDTAAVPAASSVASSTVAPTVVQVLPSSDQDAERASRDGESARDAVQGSVAGGDGGNPAAGVHVASAGAAGSDNGAPSVSIPVPSAGAAAGTGTSTSTAAVAAHSQASGEASYTARCARCCCCCWGSKAAPGAAGGGSTAAEGDRASVGVCVTQTLRVAKACMGAVGYVTDIIVIATYFGGGHTAWGAASVVFLFLSMALNGGIGAHLVPLTVSCRPVARRCGRRLTLAGLCMGCCHVAMPVAILSHALGCMVAGDGRTVAPLCAPSTARYRVCCRSRRAGTRAAVVPAQQAGGAGDGAGGATPAQDPLLKAQEGQPPGQIVLRSQLQEMQAVMQTQMPSFLVHRAIQQAASTPSGLYRLKLACDKVANEQREVNLAWIMGMHGIIGGFASQVPQLLLQTYVLAAAWASTSPGVAFTDSEIQSQLLAIGIGVASLGALTGALRTDMRLNERVVAIMPLQLLHGGAPTRVTLPARALSVIELLLRLATITVLGLGHGGLLVAALALQIVAADAVNFTSFRRHLLRNHVPAGTVLWMVPVWTWWLVGPGNLVSTVAVATAAGAVWGTLAVSAAFTAAHIVIIATDPFGLGGPGATGVAGMCDAAWSTGLMDCIDDARQVHPGVIVAMAAAWLVVYGGLALLYTSCGRPWLGHRPKPAA